MPRLRGRRARGTDDLLADIARASMIRAHEDSYCPRCKTNDARPELPLVRGTQTVRFSPARRSAATTPTAASARAASPTPTRSQLLDQIAVLTNTGRAANNLAVRELATTSAAAERPAPSRPGVRSSRRCRRLRYPRLGRKELPSFRRAASDSALEQSARI
jgi:hypothetical protein